MALFLVTAPAYEPVSLADAKLHLKVEPTAMDDDSLIDGLIRSAREYAETFTHRAFLTQTWDEKREGFPSGSESAIWLPKPPVSSITSITYTDTAGVSQTWASSQYLTDLPSGPTAQRARITPAYGITYPSTRSVMNAMTVRFVCGYGATGDFVPSSIRAAMKLLIAHWYVNREPVNVGNIVTPIQMAVESLLWPYKSF